MSKKLAKRRKTSHVASAGKVKVTSSNFSNYFRLSESYTSLILGIIVVIIASVLFISFLRGREFKNAPPLAQDISSAKIEPELTKAPIVESGNSQNPSIQPMELLVIVGNTYIIRRGDTLWNISERRYKDGSRWVDIAKANNFIDPNLIHADNTLRLPQ